ncbi:class I tRNA ligase family protein [Lysobacter korlensis]|uniref:leucine--tRNA ligase n=1 Tax=Lysobacter korlensis TaxID=553636 RepID=A0ABV6RUI5_9GAMM
MTNDSRSERGNYPVFRKTLRQWHLRITAYAERLVADLEPLDWPESIKLQQRNWIGQSAGAAIEFPIVGGSGGRVTVYSTRPETIFGATFLALSPSHPLAKTAPAAPAGQATRSEHLVSHPVTGQQLPVYIADYVLSDYGTGAVMGVPAHDDRDAVLARAERLPVRSIFDGDGLPGEDEPTLIDSAHGNLNLNGTTISHARELVTEWLERSGLGGRQYRYRLRDWLFSRQRYWGEPFPIVYDEFDVPHAVPMSQLPVELPALDDYKPFAYDPDDADSVPKAPLGRAPEWVHAELDLGDGPRRYRRETDTMPNWAGSSWYELRYLDPGLEASAWDPGNERYWLGPDIGKPSGGADLYVGGAEHAVLHLLYARFWHKVLHDLGHVSSSEPFHRLYNQGVIQAYVYRDPRGIAVEATEVQEQDGEFVWRGERVTRHLGKMGKSLKNSITPDEVCELYGADTLRLYEMSMGPLDTSRPWDTRAVVGGLRFLQRVWRNVVADDDGSRVTDDPPSESLTRQLHRVLRSYHQDVPQLRLNTAISKLIELNNSVTRAGTAPREVLVPLVQMLAPFAPHVAEELWERMGERGSVSQHPVPRADHHLLADELVTCVIQVNGKVRARISVPDGIDAESLESLALKNERVQQTIRNGALVRVIVKPPNVVNVVVRIDL